MFRSTPTDSPLDSKLEALFAEISLEVFGPEEELSKLDFATIEQRAHEVGRRVARRLAEEAAAKQAVAQEGPRPCPDCQRPCLRVVATRPLETQDGTIQLQEAEHYCSRCRRAFFPQPTDATTGPPAI